MKKFILSLFSILVLAVGGVFIYNALPFISNEKQVLDSLDSSSIPSIHHDIDTFINGSKNEPSNSDTIQESNPNPDGHLSFPQGNLEVNGLSLSKTLEGNLKLRKEAHKITEKYTSPTDKAKALYVWIAANIKYNTQYAKELVKGVYPTNMGTAIDTFNSREGVCSGFASLYFIMARDVGLNVKLVSGQGLSDPKTNSWGNHMWNEVYINNKWVPVDTTFANSYTVAMKDLNVEPELKGYLSNEPTIINRVNGPNIDTYTIPPANFFDPPNFYDTHRDSQILAIWQN